MKRFLTIILSTALIMSCFVAQASADGGETVFNFTVDGTDYTVSFGDSNLSYEELEMIAKRTLGIVTDVPQTYNIWCNAFGHNYEEVEQVVTTHKAYAVEPRCLLETFGVYTCTRCSLMDLYLKASERLYCCPEE